MAVRVPRGTTSRCDRTRSGEAELDCAERPVVDAKDIAADGGRRPRERAAEDDVAGVELLVVRGDLVGEPDDAVARVVEHAGGQAGLLDDAVLGEDRADPAQ